MRGETISYKKKSRAGARTVGSSKGAVAIGSFYNKWCEKNKFFFFFATGLMCEEGGERKHAVKQNKKKLLFASSFQ